MFDAVYVKKKSISINIFYWNNTYLENEDIQKVLLKIYSYKGRVLWLSNISPSTLSPL